MTSEEPHPYQERLSMAEEEIQTCRDAIRDKHYRAAVSRGYYAMFYATSAILLTKNIHRSKHSGVIAAFGKSFTSTGEIDGKYHRILIDAFKSRGKGDYDFGAIVTEEAAIKILQYAEDFLGMTRTYLSSVLGENF